MFGSKAMTTYSADFEEHIRDLLGNLYDYLKLADNPVADALAKDASGNERMRAIQRTVLDAIEDMRRLDQRNPTARGNRLYNILQLRYVDEQSTTEALRQLALSERQYYREHQRAIQTISRIIWDEYFADAAPAHSLADELDYLEDDDSHQVLHPRQELMAAVLATQLIAEQRGIRVEVGESPAPVTLNASQPVFRHLLIYLLNELIGETSLGAQIHIAFEMAADQPALSISSEALQVAGSGFCARLWEDGTASELMRHLKAELRWKDEPAQITVAFKREVHNILIVDDNPDTISLFKRYLVNQPYRLVSAAGEREAWAIAQGRPLMCIILDVMLPGKDGWQILQSYKSHPATANIPVLICSVLEMEDLANSLGADGYLKKPPARAELLSILSRWAE